MVTWERISDKGARRLATYPGKTQDPKISMEREGSTLRIAGVQESDFGRYTITVTNQNGIQTSDEKDVGKHGTMDSLYVTLLAVKRVVVKIEAAYIHLRNKFGSIFYIHNHQTQRLAFQMPLGFMSSHITGFFYFGANSQIVQPDQVFQKATH